MLSFLRELKLNHYFFNFKGRHYLISKEDARSIIEFTSPDSILILNNIDYMQVYYTGVFRISFQVSYYEKQSSFITLSEDEIFRIKSILKNYMPIN